MEAFPVVRLLDYEGTVTPDERRLRRLRDRPKLPPPTGRGQARPWWSVDGFVSHKRGSDFGDCGFSVVAHLAAPTVEEQARARTDCRAYNSWIFWQRYLDKQDELLTERLASQPDNAGFRLLRRQR